MKVKDLIKNKDYPLIQFRYTHPEIPEGVFFGVCKSKNGELIPLDNDSYSEDEEVLSYEKFKSEKTNEIYLDITIKGEWM